MGFLCQAHRGHLLRNTGRTALRPPLDRAKCEEKRSTDKSMNGTLVFSRRTETRRQSAALFDFSWDVCVPCDPLCMPLTGHECAESTDFGATDKSY